MIEVEFLEQVKDYAGQELKALNKLDERDRSIILSRNVTSNL